MVKFLFSITLLGLLNLAQAATLEAEVDRHQLKQQEHLLLTLKLINSDTRLRVEGVKPNIDLTLLADDFDIGPPKLDNHFNVYQGQGRSTSEVQVELFPKRSGQLIIPPFEVDGVRSQAIQIDVRPQNATQADELFARAGSNRQQLWAGQQLVVYIDLFHRVTLSKASMGDSPSSEPIDMDLLQHWKLPQASRHETIDGFDYEVERIAWAIFPEQAGPLKITLPDIWVTTTAGRQQRLPFQTLEFEIKPLPAGLPANIIIGKPELRLSTALPEEINTQQLSQWTINLRAPVPITSLPQYLPGIQLAKDLKLYMDAASYQTERNNQGIIDDASYTLSVMPLSPGQFSIPAVRIPYFDPELGRASLIELPGRTIKVVGAPVPQPESVIEKNSFQTMMKEESNHSFWQITSLAFALLWLITLALWKYQTGKEKTVAKEPELPTTQSNDQRPALQQQLLNALGSKTLEEGRQYWLKQRPEEREVSLAVQAVQEYYYGQSELSETELQTLVIRACEIIANSPHKTPIKNKASWKEEAFN